MIDELDREIHTALGAILDLAPVVGPTPTPVTGSSRRPVAVAAGLIVTVAIGVTTWLATQPEPAAPTLTAASTTADTAIATSPTEQATSTTASDPATLLPDLPADPNRLVVQTPEQMVTLSRGIGEAIRTCMAKGGFDYHLQKVFVPSVDPEVKDEAWRRQYGFGFPHQDTADPAWETWITGVQQNPAFMRALLQRDPSGRPGGCTNTAYLQIYPPIGSAVAPQNGTFNNEFGAFVVRTYGPVDQRLTHVLDPELERARSAWSACMRTLGVDATYPGELSSRMVNERPSHRPDEAASPTEITVALQDWQCEVSTGFLEHWYGRLQQLTAEFADQHAELIAQIQQWNADATARAQQAIDAGT